MYTFGIYWSFGIFYPTFDEQQSRFRVQSSQKIDIKNRKNEKIPKNSQFWTCFGVLENTKYVSPEFCRGCKVIFCSFFAD